MGWCHRILLGLLVLLAPFRRVEASGFIKQLYKR